MCSCEVNEQEISTLKTEVAFHSDLLRYHFFFNSESLEEHNAEMLSVKSQIQANHEQIKANESKFELNQSLLAD